MPGKTHGCANKERLYRIWKHMRNRCNNKNNEAYHNYGGRGIKVCGEWNDYLVFKKWAIANGYNDSLTIDRIDVNGDYEPLNCRWVTRKQQNHNQRKNIILTYRGVSKTASQWADDLGMTRSCIYHRIERGWDVKKIIETPQRKMRKKLYR